MSAPTPTHSLPEEPPAKPAKPASGKQAPLARLVGRYQVGALLGEGAMGRVYLARDPELGREVAIKVLRLDAAGAGKDAYIARFRNEARAAARFMHPNVVAVYDAGVDPGLGPYLVYEYVKGQTLRARMNEGPLESHELVALARGMSSALDALHAAGIIHRDIKPDNILLATDGAIKLTDFGIARVPDAALTRDGQFLGTPAYASPEAITKGEYTPRGDTFSLAAVLYEALCGTRPFPGEDAVSVSYSVANDTPPPPSKYVPTLPASVDAAFARALAKRSSERFQSAGELSGALYIAFRKSHGASASTTATATHPVSQVPKRPQHPDHNASASQHDLGPDTRKPGPAIVLALVLVALAFVLARRYSSEAPPIPDSATPATVPQAPESSGSDPRATTSPRSPVQRPRPRADTTLRRPTSRTP